MKTLLILMIPAISIAGEPFKEKCKDLKACIDYVSKLTGHAYTYDVDLKGKLAATDSTEIDEKNAELLLSQMLDANGYTRVPLAQPKSFTIMRQRDAKDTLLPKATANVRHAPVLPNTWDWYDLHYEVTHPEAMHEMSRVARNFMPPNTRIVYLDVANKLVVTGPVPTLRRVYELFKEMDRPVSKELKRKWEERARRSSSKKNEK